MITGVFILNMALIQILAQGIRAMIAIYIYTKNGGWNFMTWDLNKFNHFSWWQVVLIGKMVLEQQYYIRQTTSLFMALKLQNAPKVFLVLGSIRQMQIVKALSWFWGDITMASLQEISILGLPSTNCVYMQLRTFSFYRKEKRQYKLRWWRTWVIGMISIYSLMNQALEIHGMIIYQG